MRVDVRFWTAIALIAVCGFAVARGGGLVHFSVATANIASLEDPSDIVRVWAGVPGVASSALQAPLKKKVDTSNSEATNKRRDQLSALLAIKPLSSMDWLALSGMQLATEQPMDDVLQTLLLSWVTGPNEDYVMVERGIFGLSLWESLSPDLKRQTAVDLAAEKTMESKSFRAVLAAKPEEVRQEIRTALLGVGAKNGP